MRVNEGQYVVWNGVHYVVAKVIQGGIAVMVSNRGRVLHIADHYWSELENDEFPGRAWGYETEPVEL